MTDVQTQIKQAATRNAELLSTLRETDHAPPDLESQERYIADLTNQVTASDKKLKEREWKRNKEFKEHEKYRDSVVKRFAFKVSGNRQKFEARAEKEEREYFEALQKEQRERKSREELDRLLAEAKTVRDELQTAAERHRAAQQELDSLYTSIFQGPTPGFPDEDAKEQAAAAALQEYHDARVAEETEAQVVQELGQARQHMEKARLYGEEARSMSHWDMFGGGSMADMMERENLHKAEMHVQHARMSMSRAQQLSRQVGPLPDVNIAQGSIISDVLFDNIFTDIAFHDKILDSLEEVQRCQAALQHEFASAKERHQGLAADLRVKEQRLEETRTELQGAREAAFVSLGGAPPAYDTLEME
ncbi:uncharacterized protein E0L32_002845 [Thyridium curvatum]|uniref:Uncharacterized protein n=1 Tax=Thyridium curvatum TaxID=1093900 RepID=A0A507BG49_9PEZI|nr:uncharacterized protein E0L32_002845 [Thyridium curvatum]TPX17744.1 hypothetical protein E0L32_002845 [Thyridium curvatum]